MTPDPAVRTSARWQYATVVLRWMATDEQDAYERDALHTLIERVAVGNGWEWEIHDENMLAESEDS